MLNFRDIKGAIGSWLPIDMFNNTYVTVQGDPKVEKTVFSKVATPGYQLARLTDVLNVLMEAPPVRAYIDGNPEARVVREEFANMQARVALVRAGHDPHEFVRDPSIYIRMLELLRSDDPKAYRKAREEIRAWVSVEEEHLARVG